MALGDPDPQRGGPDGEVQWWVELSRLAVDAGVHGCGGAGRQALSGPGSSGRVWVAARAVKKDDSQAAGVERRAGTAGQGLVQRVRVVRDEYDGEPGVFTPQVVHQAQIGRRRAGAEYLPCGLDQRPELGVPVAGLVDGVTVDTEGHVVDEHPAVHIGQVNLALDPVGERVQRAHRIVSVDPQIKGEVVTRARGNADEG